jgi:hypothetical protein
MKGHDHEVRKLLDALPDLQPEADRRREVTAEEDRIERAARLAWEAFTAGNGHADELWRHQRSERQARWREIARAVLTFFEPNDEVKRLESQLNGLRRAYDHACAQRDKYMRRTAEWRSAALDGWDLPENILADMHWAVNEVGQTHRDNCDEAEDECGICKRFAEMKERYPEDDGGGK